MEKTIQQILVQELKPLEDQLSSIEPDFEPYILTKDEEFEVIEHEISRIEKHYAWKLTDKGINSEFEILSKMDSLDISTKIDVVEILERANSNKVYDEWQKKRRIEERLEAERKLQDIKSFWTAKNVLKLMKWTSESVYGKKLIINEQTTGLIKTICFFLSEDPRFETELNHSLSKGLLIRGVSGLGKTFLLKCVEKNERNPIHILSMIEVIDTIKSEGEFTLSMAGKKILYLDDVGTEESSVKYYGTNINWFKDFLELYYSKNKPFKNLIISTNLSFAQIEEKYGFRVRSRMKDMFNIVDVAGNDMRG